MYLNYEQTHWLIKKLYYEKSLECFQEGADLFVFYFRKTIWNLSGEWRSGSNWRIGDQWQNWRIGDQLGGYVSSESRDVEGLNWWKSKENREVNWHSTCFGGSVPGNVDE